MNPTGVITDAIMASVTARVNTLKVIAELKGLKEYSLAVDELENAIESLYEAEAALGEAHQFAVVAMATEVAQSGML